MSDEGPLRNAPKLAEGVQWLAEAIDALRPTLVIVATGAAVTTGARDRERLRAYFASLPAVEGTSVVWRPRGLWEPSAVQSMADTLGVVGGFDAIDDPAPSGALVYASLQAEGLRRSFSHAQLLDVVDKIRLADPATAFVSVESSQAVREAKLLQALSEGGP
jgi:hypothetical protein